ncbi:MAG TPA: glycosyltransferase family protein [Gemmatimonadaceae bacterium]|jgi:spore coat polysaccharide biosynthesis protein SpsF
MIGAIVQARMGSTRLPGKVLMPAAGKPLLAHLLERLGRARTLETIIVATSDDSRDDPVAALCTSLGIPVFRGSERDVLDRYYQAARGAGIDLVVRITADCPLVDPAIVDAMVQYAVEHHGEFDLVTNRRPLTFPDGLDLDVIPIDALAEAWREAREPMQREHVIPWFWDAGRRLHNLEHPANLYAEHRWTLDYAEDYALIRRVIEELTPEYGSTFAMDDVLAFMAEHPDVARSNALYITAQPVSPTGRTLPAAAAPGATNRT